MKLTLALLAMLSGCAYPYGSYYNPNIYTYGTAYYPISPDGRIMPPYRPHSEYAW